MKDIHFSLLFMHSDKNCLCIFDLSVAWRGVGWRGVAWRGVAWRGVAWRVPRNQFVFTVTRSGE